VGCPRSGTTLLQRILDHHSRLAVANDSHFIPRCIDKFAPARLEDAEAGRDVGLDAGLIDGVRSYHRFRRLGLSDEDVADAATGAATYRDLVSRLYTRFAVLAGKPLGGEKTPDYVRRLRLLSGLLPWARFVHIHRDGRDVALSVLEWAGEKKGPGRLQLWETEPVATCALWWRWQVAAGRRDGRALGPGRYHEVRYERLTSHADEETRAIVEFLGLPFEAGMLDYHRGRINPDTSLSAKGRWLPPTPGLRDWRSQMRERDVALFEELAGDLLDELGYPRATSGGSPAIADLATRSREWWEGHLEHRRVKAMRRRRRQP